VTKVPFPKPDTVVNALPPDRTDQPFGISVAMVIATMSGDL
jgi:hypothetical protein